MVNLAVVTKWPAGMQSIAAILTNAGYSGGFTLLSALPQGGEDTIKGMNAYRPQLIAEIDACAPEWILAFGNEALRQMTGHSGIMKHRGKIYPVKDRPAIQVMGTLSPAAVEISPGYAKGFYSDLRFFLAEIQGISTEVQQTTYKTVTPRNYQHFLTALSDSYGVCFDLEANSLNELDDDSVVISIACAVWNKEDTDVRAVWALPLYHPESPFRGKWKEIFTEVTACLGKRRVSVAHNGKFDCRWTDEDGTPVRITFCTMLAAHVIDENRSKSLENLSRELLGIKSWKIDARNLLSEPLKKVLRYNGMDALTTGRLYFVLRDQLKENPRLARLFMTLIMPVSNELVESERTGVWIDNDRLQTRLAKVRQTIADIDRDLMKYVPEDKPFSVNFNTSDFLRWWIYEYLGLPILERTESGMPSLSIGVKQHLRNSHPVMSLLLDRAKWVKYEAFFRAYDNLRDKRGRIHTTFKLHVAVTGRLSSGKGDTDKVIGKPPEFSVNLQQVPKDVYVRGVIGVEPERLWINADYSQIEFRLAAMVAPCLPALEAFHAGRDIHYMMASRITGKPESKVTKDERSRAKPPNYLFLYGGFARMFIETAWKEYEIAFTEDEAKALRKEFFRLWKGFYQWHEKERQAVRELGQVTTLFGRVRRLPNIYSKVESVQWQAERQAINTRIQSPASDMTQLAYLLISRRLREKGLDVKSLGTVHDSLMFDSAGDRETVRQALPIIKDTMENLPLRRMFGFELTVPIQADISVGRHWGEDVELTQEQIYDWKGLE